MTPESDFLGIDVRTVDGVIVARLTKTELWDDRSVDSLAADLLHLAESVPAPKIVIDLGAVNWVGSRMLGQIAALHKSVKAAGGRLALCNVNSEVTEVIETCRLTTLFSLYPDEASAVASFHP